MGNDSDEPISKAGRLEDQGSWTGKAPGWRSGVCAGSITVDKDPSGDETGTLDRWVGFLRCKRSCELKSPDDMRLDPGHRPRKIKDSSDKGPGRPIEQSRERRGRGGER